MGIVFWSNMPCATPPEMFTFLGASAFTLGPDCPLKMPPITPPLLPPRPSIPATPKPKLAALPSRQPS